MGLQQFGNSNLMYFGIVFIIGIVIGILSSYLIYKKYFKKEHIKVHHKDLTKEPIISNCVKDLDKCPTPTSYILQVDPSLINDYYEVSLYDSKDNLLYVKNNVSQIDLSAFNQKDIKYKIFTPTSSSDSTSFINHKIYKVPKLIESFNAPSFNTAQLKSYNDTEIDFQEALIDKAIANHFLIPKKIIKGVETKYSGIISRRSKIYLSDNDNLDISSKDISRAFLIYPSYGILTDIEGIEMKNNIHENFNIKIDEISLVENIEKLYTISCVFPLISYDSQLPIFMMFFV